ncbi:MAG: hypothetical protein QOI84_482 [Solirubrobacterales bacterium]|nr:hypothetical protein [Solirubrobacterales bacterium]
MIAGRSYVKLLATVATVVLLLGTAPARAAFLQPGPGQIFLGVSDSGVSSQFTEFSELIGKHPPVIETFRAWGDDLTGSVKRWQKAEARPILHISTADPNDGHELIDPRQIANGYGDNYLIGLNYLFWSQGIRAYVRPLGEPNRCLNVYASFDCEGNLRGAQHKPYWYRQAFRRIYILLHGGGKIAKIDARLQKAGLPPLREEGVPLPTGLPKAPIAVIWSPLPLGSPEARWNRPERFYPGRAYTDWAGTDFYSGYQNWTALTQMYESYPRRPFVLTEWGLDGSDDPTFVKHLFGWVKRHPRTKMLVYYQDFGTVNPFRIQNFPASLAAIQNHVAAPEFVPYAFEPPRPVPAPVRAAG